MGSRPTLLIGGQERLALGVQRVVVLAERKFSVGLAIGVVAAGLAAGKNCAALTDSQNALAEVRVSQGRASGPGSSLLTTSKGRFGREIDHVERRLWRFLQRFREGRRFQRASHARVSRSLTRPSLLMPRRWILPMTALREVSPSSRAISDADRPPAQSSLSLAIRSGVHEPFRHTGRRL